MIETLRIAEIGATPVKSTHYWQDLGSMTIDTLGRTDEREFMFVETEPHVNIRYHKGDIAQPGHFLSLREDPEMAQILATPDYMRLRLEKDGLEAVDIPETTDDSSNHTDVSVWSWNGIGVDQGDIAAEWGREALGRPVRLVKTSLRHPRYVEDNPAMGPVSFADGYPLLITSVASMRAVNKQLASVGKPSVDSARFRPNIVLEGGGMAPFAEDFIEEIEFESGGLLWRFMRAKPCGRCVIIDKDPITGGIKPGVQKALKGLGRKGTYTEQRFGGDEKIFFGQNHIIIVPDGASYDQPATLEKGQQVRVKYSNSPNWEASVSDEDDSF